MYDSTVHIDVEDLDKAILGNESGNRILHRHKLAEGRMDYSVISDSGILVTNEFAENWKKISETSIPNTPKIIDFLW